MTGLDKIIQQNLTLKASTTLIPLEILVMFMNIFSHEQVFCLPRTRYSGFLKKGNAYVVVSIIIIIILFYC